MVYSSFEIFPRQVLQLLAAVDVIEGTAAGGKGKDAGELLLQPRFVPLGKRIQPGHFAVDGGILDDFPNRRPLVAVSFGEQVKIRRVGSVGVVKAPGDDKILEPG